MAAINRFGSVVRIKDKVYIVLGQAPRNGPLRVVDNDGTIDDSSFSPRDAVFIKKLPILKLNNRLYCMDKFHRLYNTSGFCEPSPFTTATSRAFLQL